MVASALFTVSVAVFEVAVAGEQEFVNTARYWLPLIDTVGLLMVRVVEVAPATLVNDPPVLTCHCTVGAGLPLAAAVKVADESP